MTKPLFLPVLLAILCCPACVTAPPTGPNIVPPVADEEYEPVIKSHLQSDRIYDGFYNRYQVTAILLTSDLQNLILQRTGSYQQWDLGKLKSEKEKSFQEMGTTTKAFLSFYSPDLQYDDLSQPNSIWKVYLETPGGRFEGKVKKIRKKLVEVVNLYPFHNRWSTAYEVTFPVATSQVESASTKLTLASQLGTSILNFKPLQ